MIKEAGAEVSPASSKESLDHEADWKKNRPTPTTSEDEREIEISKPKLEATSNVVGASATSASSEQSSVRRLKSATLERVGKILRIHSKESDDKSEANPETASGEDASTAAATRKQKFNSLTRMLKFSDKEDKSKSLNQYRGRSLTRLLRRKTPAEGDNPADKPDDNVRGMFSRILGQIRGKFITLVLFS
ncbi:hypothetical protein QAD02_011607 [Eretmocerus hayati]|uniref:Uncharacterized protein n=1 Tax=Eretmocerus hayati TaxID=131215 RepID=A0ACC2NYZ4_9HYME|nr:hypothetical protein QAD02_011607 [Eretmocerus hayati]